MFRGEEIAIIKNSHHIYLDSICTDAQLDTAQPVCKEFLQLSSEPLHHSLKHIIS
jgi:hypothetical protein